MRWLRSPIMIPSLILIAVSLIYTVYWRTVRDEALAILDTWTQEQRASGLDVRWYGRTVGGFPFRITGDFTGPRATLGDGPSVRAERLLLTMMPFNLNHYMLQPMGEVVLPDFSGGELSLMADAASASFVQPRRGGPRFDAEAGVSELRRGGAEGPLLASIASGELHLAQNAEDPSLVRVFAAIADPHWPAPEAEGAPDEVVLDLQLNETDRFMRLNTLRPAIEAWAAGDGTLTIHTAAAKWDDAALAARGALQLNAEGQWSGTVTIAMAQPAVVANRLATLGLLPADTAQAVGLMAALAAGGDQKLDVELTIRDGEAELFDISLGRLPEAF